MSEDNYGLKEMLTELRLDMKEHNDRSIRMEELLAKTYEQATKTNGRVTKLETWQTMVKASATAVVTIAGLVWTGITFIFK